MIKDLWMNLPVKDIAKSKAFFKKLGVTINTSHGDNENEACLMFGSKNFVVMLFPEDTYKSFISKELALSYKSNQILFSIEVESKSEVDEMIAKAVESGGSVFGSPEDKGWLYGVNFADLDGYLWNVIYMDWANMPKE